jgi:hypothetical protein
MPPRIKKPVAFNPSGVFEGALKKIKKEEIESSGKVYDVVSFAKDMLGQNPYPAQEIILKFFYAGTRYNEKLRITESDLEIIENWSLPNHWLTHGETAKINIFQRNIEKFYENPELNYFRDLVLILGRRSGKSWISSLIAVYEAYKLVSVKDPLKLFGGLDGDLWIINTAVTGEQAKSIIFKQIRKFVHKCPVLEERICKEGDDVLVFYTDADIENNERIKKNGGLPLPGTVVIASGNSNSAALRGHTATMIIYDEMAHYVDTSGKSSGKAVYAALQPSVSNLYFYGEGRNVVISSPDMPSGFFYDHFKDSQVSDTALVFQIPTWDANPKVSRASLEPLFVKDPDRASAEYGAQFRSHASSQYFPPELVDQAMRRKEGWYKQTQGFVNLQYFMHLDPAKNSDRWAVVICHPEMRLDPDTKQYVQWIVQDYSKVFKPSPGGIIDPNEIMDNHILPLFKKFKIVSLTSDQFFSVEQQTKLRNAGIRFNEISYNGANKNKIYETMRDYFINGRIELCNDDMELAGELKNIRIDYDRNPPKIDKNSQDKDFPNDDLPDCLGGAIFSIMQGAKSLTRLPQSKIVYTGRR